MKNFSHSWKKGGFFVGALVAFFSVYLSLNAAPVAPNSNISADATSTPSMNNISSNVTSTPPITSIAATGVSNPTCLDNYQTWPSSTTFKANAPWSTAFVSPLNNTSAYYSTNTVSNAFERDINGDGLVDYIFASHNYNGAPSMNYTKDCVYLSNGSGWTLAYRCYSEAINGVPKYYGDCADTGM